MTHELKIWPEPFAAVRDGRKRYEVRRNDRDYRVGDVLVLNEYIPCAFCDQEGCSKCGNFGGHYTRCRTRMRVTYITEGGNFGLPPEDRKSVV